MAVAEAGVPTIDELAKHFGRSRQTVQEWLRRDCPRGSFEDVEAWLKANISGFRDDDDDAPSVRQQIELERLRKLRAEADALERQNLVDAGRLLDRDSVVDEFADWLSYAKPILESLPDDLAKEVPEDLRLTIQHVSRNAIQRLCRKLAAWRPQGDA